MTTHRIATMAAAPRSKARMAEFRNCMAALVLLLGCSALYAAESFDMAEVHDRASPAADR